MPLSIPKLHAPIARYFRQRRFRRFESEFGVGAGTTIVDVGGYHYYWDWFQARPRVVIVNLEPPAQRDRRFAWVVADARRLPFRDGAFDIAFSNSVVEHIPGEENRRAYARELMRVGRGYYVQTPYRWFPIEPHLMTPFIHYLPRRWQRPLLRYGTVWGLLHHPTPQGCDDFLRDIQLLTTAELRALFPGAQIWKERALGLLKSITAVRKPTTRRLQWAFYVRNEHVYVPTMAVTEAGYHLEIEPVEVAPVDDVTAVAMAIEAVLARSNPVVPTPTRAKFPKPVVPRYANVKSWQAFMQGATRWGITREHGRYAIVPYVPYDNGGLREDSYKKEELGDRASIRLVARRAAERSLMLS